MSAASLIPAERIESRILVLRGQRVVLDRDLAALYGVSTKRLARLSQCCADATTAEAADGAPGRRYDFVYVDQPGFEEHRPITFAALAASFTEYKV